MSKSETYAGNPLISRRLRQQNITIFNARPDEVDGEKVYDAVFIEGVQVISDYGIAMSQRGIDTTDTCKVRADMRDCVPFSVNVGVDMFIVGSTDMENPTRAKLEAAGFKVFKINKVNPIKNINDEVDIMELYAS